jgi:hypothetical protein
MYDIHVWGGIEMDVVVILTLAILAYAVLIYNRMQKLWQAVQEGLANVDMEVGILADLTRRVTDRPGDLSPLAARLAEVEQDLLLRRGRCNAAIATYNTYRAQIPQVMLSRLAGFRPVEFPAVSPAASPPPSAAVVQLDVPGLRAVSDPVVLPWPQRPDSEGAERRPPRL